MDIWSFKLKNNIYGLYAAVEQQGKLTMDNLHKRMGHLNIKLLKFMESKEMAIGMENDGENPQFCKTCPVTKMKRDPFTKGLIWNLKIFLG